jgi:hypothetical protein
VINLEWLTAAWLRPRGVNDLLPGGFMVSLAAIVAGLVLSFLLFGFWWPYWRVFDQDMVLAYEALLLNDGLPQEYVDHPGYWTILLLGRWYGLLQALGLMDVHALSLLPPPAEAGAAWMAAVRAGRVLSLALAIGFVAAFALLLRRLVGDWRIAALGAFALAYSGGFAMAARVIRTELVSAGLVALALLVLLIAARNPQHRFRPLLVGLSALLATLGLENKVQAIVLICALPAIAIPFGRESDPPGAAWRDPRRAWPMLAALATTAGVLTVAALMLTPGLIGALGLFNVAVAAWVAIGILAFAMIWRVPAAEMLAAMLAVAAGCALALLALNLRYAPQNVVATVNPLAHAFTFAVWSDSRLTDGGSVQIGALMRSLIEGLGDVIARRTFVLKSSARPTIFLEWLVIVGAVAAYRARAYRLAMQVAVLMLVVWGVDTVSTLRSLKGGYAVYTDPLVIVAAALLLAELAGLQRHRFAFQIGVALIWAHILVGHAEPVKHTLSRKTPPVIFCQEHNYYTRRVRSFPFCPAARASENGTRPDGDHPGGLVRPTRGEGGGVRAGRNSNA